MTSSLKIGVADRDFGSLGGPRGGGVGVDDGESSAVARGGDDGGDQGADRRRQQWFHHQFLDIGRGEYCSVIGGTQGHENCLPWACFISGEESTGDHGSGRGAHGAGDDLTPPGESYRFVASFNALLQDVSPRG